MAVTWVTGQTIDSARENDYYEYFFSALGEGTITYKKTSGTLPPGLSFSSNGRLAGIPEPIGTLQQYRFAVRATDSEDSFRDRVFDVTVSGQKYIDLLPDILDQTIYPLPSFLETSFAYHQLSYSLPSVTRTPTFSVTAGSLPLGLSLNANSGIISGVTAKTSVSKSETFNPELYYFDATPFDSLQFNVTTVSISNLSRFSITASDGLSQDTKQYSMVIVSADDLRADVAEIEGSSTAADILSADCDSITIDADSSRVDYPVITTQPGNLGTIRQSTRFLYKIDFVDPEFENNISDSPAFLEITSGSLPNGLTITKDGWINGLVLPENLINTVYNFSVICRKPLIEGGETYLNSAPINFSITVKGEIDAEIDWINTSTSGNFSNLGAIFTGEVSTLYISAASRSNQALQYELVNGGHGGLPPGLVLLKDGTISGRPSFDIPDNTKFSFRVSVNDNSISVNTEQVFTLTVTQRTAVPYDNLYIQYQGDENARDIISRMINDGRLIPGEYVYRPLDPWFGKNKSRRILFMTGLEPTSLNYWGGVLTSQNNHYDKTITFGELKAARALDNNFNTLYEVIYVEIVDNYIDTGIVSSSAEVQSDNSELTVYPNSFIHSASKIKESVGQETQSVLPPWMSSEQEDGTVPGFTRALVLAYLNPGRKEEVLFNLKNAKSQLKLATFTYNGYDLDNSLSLRYRNNSNSFPTSSYTLGTGNITCNTSSNIVLGVNNTIQGLGTITSTLINTSLDPSLIKYSPGLRGNTFSVSGNIYVPEFTTYNVGDIVAFSNGEVVGMIESIRSANILTLDRAPVSFVNEEFLVIRSSAFTQELYVGDEITNGNIIIGTVANIISDSALILTENANLEVTDDNYYHTIRDSYSVPFSGDKYITFSNIGVLG
jgi:hypothetical protein